MVQAHYVLEVMLPDGRKISRTVEESSLILGRSTGRVDVEISDEKASGRHAEIRFIDGVVSVVDLGSTNGVQFHGETKKKPFAIRAGDTFEIGTTTIRIATIVDPRVHEARTVAIDAPVFPDDKTEVRPLMEDEPAAAPPRGAPKAAAARTVAPKAGGSAKRRTHATKFIILVAAGAAVTGFFLPFLTVDMNVDIPEDAASGLPDSVKEGLATLAGADGDYSGLQTAQALMSGTGFVQSAAAEADSRKEELAKLAEAAAKDEKEAKENRELAEGTGDALRGAATGMKIVAGIVAAPFALGGLIALIALIGLFMRFGRLAGFFTMLLGLVALAPWALFYYIFLQVPFLSGGLGFFIAGGGLALCVLCGLFALIKPEPKLA